MAMDQLSKLSAAELLSWLEERNVPADVVEKFEEHEMDGQSLVTLVDTGVQGPDCLRELIPKIGVRLKVYSYIIKDKEAQATQGNSSCTQQSTKKKGKGKSKRKVSVKVVMLDAVQEKVPKGDSKKELEQTNRILNIFMARSDSKNDVKQKICSVFNVKDYTVLECIRAGSRLIVSSNQELNGLDAIQRRGSLYLAKKSDLTSTAAATSPVPGSNFEEMLQVSSEDQSDVDLPPAKVTKPATKKRKLSINESEPIVLSSTEEDDNYGPSTSWGGTGMNQPMEIHTETSEITNIYSTGEGSLRNLDHAPVITSANDLLAGSTAYHSDDQDDHDDYLAIADHNVTYSDNDDINCAAYRTIHHASGEGFPNADDEFGPSSSTALNSSPLNQLLSLFQDEFTDEQLATILDLASNSFDDAMECLLTGPNLKSILKLMFKLSKTYPIVKFGIDDDEAWTDLVSFYKATNVDVAKCRLRIRLQNQPAIDTGGVRCQVYTTVLQQFAENLHFHLFDGQVNHLRPHYSAANRSSGLFKVLGCIVGHSIKQDVIGFPHFSPLCYWYIVGGEEVALQYITENDVGSGCCELISKLNESKTDEEVQAIFTSESMIDFLDRAGVSLAVNLTNKHEVGQSIMQHEALFKISKLLDQLKEGLRQAKMLRIIQSFPEQFSPLFISEGSLTADDVIRALCTSDRDTITVGFLHQYIRALSEKELQDFLILVTGTTIAKDRSIIVHFDDDTHGSIAAHTCSNEIHFPLGVFKEYEVFKMAMDAVVCAPDKKKYNII